MKGSNGKKKSKYVFSLKQNRNKKNYLESILEKRLAKWEFKNQQREKDKNNPFKK